MRNRYLIISIATGAGLSAAIGYAACLTEFETVIRGRFVRCESTQFYWDASGADRVIQQAFDRSLAQTDPRFHERLRERWREQGILPGDRRPQYDLVAVVRVEWQAFTIAPWRSDTSEVVELQGPPHEFHEMVRYLWRGSREECENAEEWSFVDLWVTHPCCDTGLPGDDGCLLRMNYAMPAPEPMRAAMSKALEDR